MVLYVIAKSPVMDFVIDFIEVRLKTGEIVPLNWDESYMDRHNDLLDARYVGVCFDEESAAGRLKELEGMQVEAVGMYSEEYGEGEFPIVIENMDFFDGDGNELHFENVYTYEPAEEKSQSVSEKM